MKTRERATLGVHVRRLGLSLLIVLAITVVASCDSGPGSLQSPGIQGSAERPAYILNYSQRALYALDLEGPGYLGHLQLDSPSITDPTFSPTKDTLYVFANRETRVAETGAAILGFDTARNEIVRKILLPAGYLWHELLGMSRLDSFYLLGSTHSADSDTPPAQYVVEVDASTGAVSRKIRLRSQYDRHRASSGQISPDGRWASVINYRVSQNGDTTNFHQDETSLVLVDLRAGKQVREVRLGHWLRSPTFAQDGKVLFASSMAEGKVYRIDLSTFEVEAIYTLPEISSSRKDERRPFPVMLPVPKSHRVLLHYAVARDTTHFIVFNAEGTMVEEHIVGTGGRSVFCDDAALCLARPARESETFPSEGPNREVSSEMTPAIIQAIDMKKWEITRNDTVKIPKHALQASELLVP